MSQHDAAEALNYDHRKHARATEQGWWAEYDLDDQGYISLEHDACKVSDHQVAVAEVGREPGRGA
ncbi:hypothetical protein K7G98_42180, partial [Saccharothrix sp. MB29]|nr:hypothetical protein [Saccharothrix sp. MB29]